MSENHPFDLTVDSNRKVFEHINKLSAHSDIVEPLLVAVKPLGDVQIFTPDRPNGYGYYAVSTKGIIFGFAIGMETIAFRLDSRMKQVALLTGGVDYPKCGPDWTWIEPFRCDWPKPDWEFWARKAYVYARESVL
jgi:hypothetical protein